jgi:hypothetical protein
MPVPEVELVAVGKVCHLQVCATLAAEQETLRAMARYVSPRVYMACAAWKDWAQTTPEVVVQVSAAGIGNSMPPRHHPRPR